MKKSASGAMLVIAFLFTIFILKAMPVSITSVGWPTIRDEFGLRQDSIGLFLIMTTVGYFLSGAFNGRLLYRFGAQKLFMTALLVFSLSMVGYWWAPVWGVLVVMGLFVGWAGGTIDATSNTIVAARYNERIMNWLHGFFGVGATLGPLAISLVIFLGSDWRGSALVFGALLLMLFAFVAIVKPLGKTAVQVDDLEGVSEESDTSTRETLSQPIVWIAILFFFFYGGTEVSIGQWAFTLFTESRGFNAEIARLSVSLYWGTFTIGRFAFGFISAWLPTKTWLRSCMILNGGALFLLLFPHIQSLSLVAVAISGIAQAPIFATLVSLMPRIVGRKHASNVIGYVVGAGGIGIAISPSVAGILAEQTSLEAIPPFILGQALILLMLFELLMRQHAQREAQFNPALLKQVSSH